MKEDSFGSQPTVAKTTLTKFFSSFMVSSFAR
jgi:hypothetical protein